MACDLIVASSTASLGLPEVTLGIIPGFGGIPRLVHRVGFSRARSMVLSGDLISAEVALEWGLVYRVVPAAEVRPAAMALAARYAKSSLPALRAAKRALAAAADLPLDSALHAESAQFMDSFGSLDRAEGLRAFLERRKPRFESP